MLFEELWELVEGLPDTAKLQIPEVLTAVTKKKMAGISPEKVRDIVLASIDEVNHGSIEPLDVLINKRL